MLPAVFAVSVVATIEPAVWVTLPWLPFSDKETGAVMSLVRFIPLSPERSAETVAVTVPTERLPVLDRLILRACAVTPPPNEFPALVSVTSPFAKRVVAPDTTKAPDWVMPPAAVDRLSAPARMLLAANVPEVTIRFDNAWVLPTAPCRVAAPCVTTVSACAPSMLPCTSMLAVVMPQSALLPANVMGDTYVCDPVDRASVPSRVVPPV